MSTPKKVKKKTKKTVKTVKTVKHPSPRAVNIIKGLISVQGEHGNWNYSITTMKEVLTLLGFVCLCIVCIVLWIAVNFSTSAVIFMIGGFVLIAAYCGTDSSD